MDTEGLVAAAPNSNSKNKWTQRFFLASIIQGAIAVLLTIMLASFIISTPYAERLISNVSENPSIGYIEISALAGLGLYFLIGVLATFEIKGQQPILQTKLESCGTLSWHTDFDRKNIQCWSIHRVALEKQLFVVD